MLGDHVWATLSLLCFGNSFVMNKELLLLYLPHCCSLNFVSGQISFGVEMRLEYSLIMASAKLSRCIDHRKHSIFCFFLFILKILFIEVLYQ